ncbi:MAG: hypothetical protein IPO26_10940 [Saprospiraceae bacterium]|nr:hypothetical protein [Saprospiraceae bacterium]
MSTLKKTSVTLNSQGLYGLVVGPTVAVDSAPFVTPSPSQSALAPQTSCDHFEPIV